MSGLNEKQPVPAPIRVLAQDDKTKLDESSVAPPPVGVDNIVTRDGVRLHPQPTTDPLDPLNWSSFQKHTILAIVMFLYVTLNTHPHAC